MYCTKCGTKLNEGTSYCPNCGYNVNGKKTEGWSEFADTLTAGSFSFSKFLLRFLGGGMTIACIVAGLGCLAGGCYMLYFFASGTAVMIPALLSSFVPAVTISGTGLLFGGIATMFTSLMLFGAAKGLRKGIREADQVAQAA